VQSQVAGMEVGGVLFAHHCWYLYWHGPELGCLLAASAALAHMLSEALLARRWTAADVAAAAAVLLPAVLCSRHATH